MANIVSAGPGYTTYQAKIIKPDGYPLEASNVNFRFTILNPLGTCILYSENYSAVNMAGTGGVISFALGSGVKIFPASATTFADVFSNITPALSCDVGGPGIYNPGSSDVRKIVMQFHDGNGWQTLPAMNINAVPYAMYANDALKLGGVSATSFVQRTEIPSCSGGEAMFYNGTSFSCVTVGGGGAVSAAAITSALGYTPANGASITAVSSDVSALSNYAANVSSTVFSVSSTVTSLENSFSSFQATTAASFAALAGSGIGSFNGSSSATQSLNNSLTGTAPAFVTANGVHTLNIPYASAATTTAGLISNADYSLFSTVVNKITSSAASIAQVLGYTPADQAAVTTLSSTVGSVSATANAALAMANAVSSSVNSLGSNKITSSAASVAEVLGYTAADQVVLTALTSTVGAVSTTVNTALATANSKITSSAAAIAQVLGYVPGPATGSTQWTTSGSAITYNSGNVGVGVANPRSKLNVVGNLGIMIGDWGGGTMMNQHQSIAQAPSSFTDSLAEKPYTLIGGNSFLDRSEVLIGGSTNMASEAAAQNIIFYTHPTKDTALGIERMRVDRNGNVGIGTNNPSYALQVSGTIATTNGGVRYPDNTTQTTAFVSGASGISQQLGYVPANAATLSSFQAATIASITAISGSGISSLNGSTSATQSFANGTNGTAPNFASAAGVHTLNIPYASAGTTTAGVISNTDYSLFSTVINKITSSAASIAQVLGYTPADQAQVTTLSSTIAAVSTTANSKITSSAASVAEVLGYIPAASGAVTSTQWTTSGTTINYGTGNVGIGSVNPVGKLDVSGKVHSTGGMNNNGYFIGSNTSYGMYEFTGTLNFQSLFTNFFLRDTTTVNSEVYRLSARGGATDYSIISAYNNGNVGIGFTNPTAKLHVASGNTTVAAFKLTSGALTSSPSSGAIEYDGYNLYFTDGSNTRRALAAAGSGVSTFNGSTSNTQTLAAGTAGTAPSFSTVNGVHTLNIPYASVGTTTAGLISNTDYSLFSTVTNKITSSAASIAQALGYVPAASGVISSQWNTSGTTINYLAGNVGVGTVNPVASFSVSGTTDFTAGNSVVPAQGATQSVFNKSLDVSISNDYSSTSTFLYGNKSTFVVSSASTASDLSKLYLIGNLNVTNYAAPASTTQVIGASIRADVTNAGGVGTVIGTTLSSRLLNSNSNNGTVKAANVVAMVNGSAGSTGSASEVYGVDSLVSVQGGNSANTFAVGTAYGFRSQVGLATASGSINAAYGMYIDNGLNGSSTGSITHQYGLYVREQNLGTTNKWNIMSAGGASRNYFEGKIGLGEFSPSAYLHIGATSGTQASLKINSGTLLASPQPGAIEFDGTNLYYTDNSSVRRTLAAAGGGVGSFNGSTSSTQTLAAGTAGTAPSFSTVNGVHTLNIPYASVGTTTAGLISNADYANFNNKVSSQWTTSGTNVFYNTGNVGINSSTPAVKLAVNGQVSLGLNNSIDVSNGSNEASLFGGRNAFIGSGGSNEAYQFGSRNTINLGGAGSRSVYVFGARNVATDSSVILGYNVSNTATNSVAIGYNKTTLNILDTGMVGIGTTAPGAELAVSGTIRAANLCDETGANCKDLSGGWNALTNFTESVNTAAPNATVPVVRLLANNAATNVDVALSPKGTGGLSAHSADNTAAGGNKRGTNSVDWQTNRSLAGSVAGAADSVIGGGVGNSIGAGSTGSVIAGGGYNVAGGSNNAAIGGGSSNSAGGQLSTVPGGYGNSAAAYGSTAMGYSTTANGHNSLSANYFTTTAAYAQSVFGAYNLPKGGETANSWVTTDPLFTIGNGTGATSRSTAVMVLKNGNVGVGLNTPTALLHLTSGSTTIAPLKLTSGSLLTTPASGSIEYDGFNFYATNGAGTRSSLTGIVGSQWTTSGTAIGYLNGSVGVGTASPRTAFDVAPATGQSIIRATSTNSTSALQLYRKTGSAYAGPVLWSNGTTLNFGYDTSENSGPTLMTLDTNGNLGIGTTGPSAALEVYRATGTDAAIAVTNASAGNGAYVTSVANSNFTGFTATGVSQTWFTGQYGSRSYVIGDLTNGKIPVSIDSNTPSYTMVILASGTTGIGVTAPNAKLHIASGSLTVAPLKMTSGALTTAAQAGAVEYDGYNLYFTNGAGTRSALTGAASGAGSAAGSDMQIQYNSGGLMTASASFTWNGATNALNLANPNGGGGAYDLNLRPNGPYGQIFSQQIKINANNVLEFGAGGPNTVHGRFENNGNFGIGYVGANSRLVVQGAGATSATSALNIIDSTQRSMLYLTNDGSLGLGTLAPTARLTITSGTTTFAPMKFTSGSLLASPQSGTIEYDGFNFYMTNGANTRTAIAGGWSSSGTGIYNNAGTVAIGTNNPTTNSQVELQIQGDYSYTGVGGGQLRINGNANTNKRFEMGLNVTTDVGFLQAYTNGGATQAISLNPDGGNVGIGVSMPVVAAHIVNTGASNEGLRVERSPATSPSYGQFRNGVGRLNVGVEGSVSNTVFTGSTQYAGYIDANGRDLFMASGNSAKITLKSTGDVGIGTDAPSFQLDVQTANAITGRYLAASNNQYSGATHLLARARGSTGSMSALQNNDTIGGLYFRAHNGSDINTTNATIEVSAYGTQTGSNRANYMIFETTASGSTTRAERMRISELGYVGIGTSNPYAPLSIGPNSSNATVYLGYVGSYLSTGGQAQWGGNWASSGYWGIGPSTNAGDNTVRIGNMSSSGTWAGTQDIKLAIGSGGLGVGTTPATNTPIDVLKTSGDLTARFKADGVDTDITIHMQNDAQTWKLMNKAGNNDVFVIEDTTASKPSFYIAKSTGRVGIGQTSIATLTYQLEVSGTVAIASGSALRIGNNNICTSGGCTSSSDIRLKENIKPLDFSLEKLLSLKGVQYDWKDKATYGDKHQVGFIAQELEKVYPEVVYTDKDSGLKSVSYGHLIAPMVEALKLIYVKVTKLFEQTKENTRAIASLEEKDSAKDQKIKDLQLENERKDKELREMKERLDKIEKALLQKTK